MSETQTQQTTQSTTTENEDNIEIEHVGFELEYPAKRGSTDPLISDANKNSRPLRHSVKQANGWPVENVRQNARGRCGTDHCGAEIRSGVMKLHSGEPEAWYRGSIEVAENAGYEFAPTGYGRSKFGLHTHLSPIKDDVRNTITEATRHEEWTRVFFCSSISSNSADPWRHYSASRPQSPFSYAGQGLKNDPKHYEFRLQEPVLPEHFGLVCEFWRKVDLEGAEAALDYARDLVVSKDDRLTAIQRFRALREHNEDWPNEETVASDSQTSTDAAKWFVDLME